MNGDGISDIVLKDMQWGGKSRIRVWYGMGSGRFEMTAVEMKNVPDGYNDEVYLVDVNRDGMADLVQLTGQFLWLMYNTGDETFTFSGVEVNDLRDALQSRLRGYEATGQQMSCLPWAPDWSVRPDVGAVCWLIKNRERQA
jgi:hypothetical protein